MLQRCTFFFNFASDYAILQIMTQLPDDFIQLIRPFFGNERFERFTKALDDESSVSIRLNPEKISSSPSRLSALDSLLSRVPWCRQAYYLPTRPNFTFDPLLHAGCYYVQEASSMFLDEVLRQHLPDRPLMALDLCAAPGGKSTLMRAALPEGSTLYSNEPNKKRASILLENVSKWGYDQHFVTCCYPKDYRKAKMMFDVILCDVPCSGEGMFRKDPDSIKEWSLQNVEQCQQLQREIVCDAWQCLEDGGLLIYSTCTYNTKENEENVRWIKEELGAEILQVKTKEEWGITGSLLEGFNEPVYRFIPGYTKGEGLFMAVMRKSSLTPNPLTPSSLTPNPSPKGEGSDYHHSQKNKKGNKSFNKENENKDNKSAKNTGIAVLTTPLSLRRGAGGEALETLVALSYPQAIAYLRGEAIILPPDTPKGIITVTFEGFPLGPVKNIGSRANNLYPKEWRIKSTYIPKEYEAILRLT